MGYISPEIGRVLASQLRESQARMAERARRGKERYAGRPRVEEVPSEALGCPQCKAHYPFGYDCPDCQVSLMPLCALDLEAPPPERFRFLKLAAALLLFITPFVLTYWFTVFSDRRDFLLRMPGILD